MPRPSKKNQGKPNAIVASAARVVAGRRKNLPSGTGSAWQTEAWEMLDTVGELEFYREWMANAMTRCTLEVIEVLDDGTEQPVTAASEGDAAVAWQAMEALFGGAAGQAEMLGMMGGHLAIPGETWLVGLLEPPADPDIDMWRVLSKDEVKEQGNRWQIDRGDGEPEVYARDEVYVTRIWRPHPRKGVEAHSSVRSALPILRQMVGLEKRDAANIDSRLIGNGILAVPTEVTFASPATPDDDGQDPEGDPFLAALIEAGTAAIENPGSAEALFPLLVRAPAANIDKIKHITLASELDNSSMDRLERLIKRLANSLDVPAEVLLGLADVNHWTGWLLDENAIKMHVETTLAIITGGVQTRYLWPCLQGESESFDPALRRFLVRGSTAALRQRPNRAAEATAARADLVITDAAWAREVGFEEGDLLDPTSDEYKRKMIQKTAGGVTTADVTVSALDALGISLVPKPSEVEPTAGPAAAPPAPTPPAIEAPTDARDNGMPSQQQAAALIASAEPVVLRAIEKAWNKAGKRGRERTPVEAAQLDACLDGAWAYLESTAALLGLDQGRLVACCDDYARKVLVSGADHDRRILATSLFASVLAPPSSLGARGA